MPESKGRRRNRARPSRSRRGSFTPATPAATETVRKFNWPRFGLRLRPRTWKKVRRWSFIGAAATFAVLIIVSFAITSFPGGIGGQGQTAAGDGAQIGDHWHSSLLMEICGETMTLPPSGTGIHSHGDGLIHVHPYNLEEAGLGANIGRFFDSFPLEIYPDRVETLEGEIYQNGDPCPDGTIGTVQVLVNGQDITETFREYTPKDEDTVEVYFREVTGQGQQES